MDVNIGKMSQAVTSQALVPYSRPLSGMEFLGAQVQKIAMGAIIGRMPQPVTSWALIPYTRPLSGMEFLRIEVQKKLLSMMAEQPNAGFRIDLFPRLPPQEPASRTSSGIRSLRELIERRSNRLALLCMGLTFKPEDWGH